MIRKNATAQLPILLLAWCQSMHEVARKNPAAKTQSGSILTVNYTLTMHCCNTDQCNGAASVQLSLTAALCCCSDGKFGASGRFKEEKGVVATHCRLKMSSLLAVCQCISVLHLTQLGVFTPS
ncbi:hypothetical protein E3U43_010631 [Larimichthys crocea]|uniref:Uncharacterized protein n=1 Tax=Larimichthys crocea TaxID=215358 RepID=A0ACD3RG37_LARCR|nr:hypothetical protein E3U43_010631 [Larimichthys crocea]